MCRKVKLGKVNGKVQRGERGRKKRRGWKRKLGRYYCSSFSYRMPWYVCA